jgi:hypothetical protein
MRTRCCIFFWSSQKTTNMTESNSKRTNVFTGVKCVAPPSGGNCSKGISFVDHGGPVLSNVGVFLIFYDPKWWNSTPPPTASADQITAAVGTILSSSYRTGLAQYRGAASNAASLGRLVTDAHLPEGWRITCQTPLTMARFSPATLPTGQSAADYGREAACWRCSLLVSCLRWHDLRWHDLQGKVPSRVRDE